MNITWNDIKEILNVAEPILLVIVPTCFGIWLKLQNKLEKEKDKISAQDKEKNQSILKNWEHVESMNVIKSIKMICNLYRDVGHMDSVSYIQLENGTVATSKLSNMFVTCLAEDSRGSIMPKLLPSIQRVSYSRVTEFIDDARDKVVIMDGLQSDDEHNYRKLADIIPGYKLVDSYVISPVKDSQGYLVGFCLFLYTDSINFSADKDNRKDLITKFAAGVETVLLEYNSSRKNKKKELNL